MTTPAPTAPEPTDATPFEQLFAESIDKARSFWWAFLLLGVVLIVGGLIAISYPFVSSVAAVMVFGTILVISGVFTILGAFWAGRRGSLLLQLLVGILYVVAGVAIRDTPIESTAILTLFAAAFFIVAGAFRIVVSLVERFPQWGWVLINGVVTLLAGVIIYDTFPSSALWLIGLLLGLDLLFNGWSWVMLALFLRALPLDEATESEPPTE